MTVQKMTLEQKRAADALRQIKALKGQPSMLEGKFCSYVKRLPAEILTEGLGQALATHLAAGGGSHGADAHELLYRAVSDWLCRDDTNAPYHGYSNVIEGIVQKDAATYRQAQTEAMSYLIWLKKFAVAFLTESVEDPS